MNRLIYAIAFVFFLATSSRLQLFAAVAIHPNAGTTAASFLKLGAGSRAVSMGNSFAAVADDATALYWNPAGLAQLKYREVTISHNESFENIRHDFAAYAAPMFGGTAGVALYGLYTPKDIERRTGLNESDPYEPISPVEGLFQAYDMALHVSYARWVKRNLSLGASLKFIQQSIDTYSAGGAAADLGALYIFDSMPLSLGFAAQHIGTPVKFIEKEYQLPLNFKLGAAYKFNSKLTAALDLNQPNDNFLFVSAGGEYRIIKLLAFRMGYKYRVNGQELGDLSGMSAGLGFNMPLYNFLLKLDYAFLPFGVLGDSHRITLGILFGQSEASDKPVRKIEKQAKKQIEPEKTEPAPALPQQPAEFLPLKTPQAGYVYYDFKITSRIKAASGKGAVYTLRGISSGGDIMYFDGLIQNYSPSFSGFEFGEKPGEAEVYKSFVFKTKLPVRGFSCKVRVDKSFGAGRAVDKTGNQIRSEIIAEDAKFTYHRVYLDTPIPFSIVK